MIKSIKKILLMKLGFGTFLIIFLLISSWIGYSIHKHNESIIYIDKIYVTILDIFDVGESSYHRTPTLCIKRSKNCLNGEIKSMRQDSVRESVYYIYYARDIIGNKQIVFQRDFAIYPNIDFEYILILGTKLYFHSDETLKLLPERQQNIFKELKENQKIVIDGKEYKGIWWE